MANSISFNDVDLSAYGLELLNYPEVFEQLTESLQVQERAWGLTSLRPARVIEMEVGFKAADLAARVTALDNIKKALSRTDDCKLEIASITDRYWMARFGNISGKPITAKLWKGTITFKLFAPMAYDNTEEDNDHAID